MTEDTRIEHDSLGEVEVPADALWGAQTQRAVSNFPISGQPIPRSLIRALGLVKAACAEANQALGLLDAARAEAIAAAAHEVANGRWDEHFPVDVYQTGSGTSSNMNANEVIARLAAQSSGLEVHPNDHVNLGQSSNDVFPSAIRVAASLVVADELRPALDHLVETIEVRADEHDDVVKTGRTHLMDAMPIRLGQELRAWADQLRAGGASLDAALTRLARLPIGGTAVGTGINAPPELGSTVAARLAEQTGVDFAAMERPAEGMAGQEALVEASGAARLLATTLTKIANDLRWMNSGPLAGLGEIVLPVLQPGSSIMPGKVNPVIPEAVAMVAARVIGNDATVALAGASGSFQLNVMLPVMAQALLESLHLLATSSRVLADQAIAGFDVVEETLDRALARNPILVTALNPVIGYERGAAIAKRAYAEGRPLLDVALEMTDLSRERLESLLDPVRLTEGGLVGEE